jgi:hypothetical protein
LKRLAAVYQFVNIATEAEQQNIRAFAESVRPGVAEQDWSEAMAKLAVVDAQLAAKKAAETSPPAK